MGLDITKRLNLRQKIKIAIIVTILGLISNGISAFPLQTELAIVIHKMKFLPTFLLDWLHTVYTAVTENNNKYPFMVYGYYWLGFAHFLIAIAFLGPLRDPIRNHWVIQWGMIAALLSVVMALVIEPMREVPFFWALLDAAVAAAGFIVLWLCNRWIQKLIKMK
ncbi:MAG: hypothetical protein H0W62_06695 [Chitinophagales bacterium]|nr:hypothetical protein [Chitinophagales bacterium]